MSNEERLFEALNGVVRQADSDILQVVGAPTWQQDWYLRNVIVRHLNKVLDEKIREVSRLHTYEQDNSDLQYVIHYTSLDTVVAILSGYAEGQETYLRMYDSFHLNDPEEGRYLKPFLATSERFDWFAEEQVSHAYVASFIIPKRGNRER